MLLHIPEFFRMRGTDVAILDRLNGAQFLAFLRRGSDISRNDETQQFAKHTFATQEPKSCRSWLSAIRQHVLAYRSGSGKSLFYLFRLLQRTKLKLDRKRFLTFAFIISICMVRVFRRFSVNLNSDQDLSVRMNTEDACTATNFSRWAA